MQVQCPKCKQWLEDEDGNGKCELCGANLNQIESNPSEQINSEVELYLKQKKEAHLKIFYFVSPLIAILLFLIGINFESAICFIISILLYMTWHISILIHCGAFNYLLKNKTKTLTNSKDHHKVIR